ncbi:cutinase family protein [Mycobacterium sp. 1274761.0]|uniref:cutinase family protein n=1 Tax=Mycobacterium sp. 1274761.0 TaxID=1834077 RepID=UPI0007FF8B22|nr:cutinase family protein [Mycobacterium sp. 1274761.0]OBK78800.1 cutinase [Mycobacterium sp. 1274761.0]
MNVKIACSVVGATLAALPLALGTVRAAVPVASAAPCQDVEIVFARGTTEPPGVGGIGQAFVDSVRSKAAGRSVGVYAVRYPASNDFARSAPAGGDDMSAHVQAMAASCPNTKMVLGGYSQGAAVVDLATTAMPPAIADHVAAAAEFGGPRSSFADSLSAGPLPSVGPIYRAKTIEMCVPNDPICAEGGWDMRAHGAYVQTGMVDEAATFAANRL